MSDTQINAGGPGFFGLLTILFIGLKLTGYVAWSWIWVLSPIWGPILIVLVGLAIVVVAMFVYELLTN